MFDQSKVFDSSLISIAACSLLVASKLEYVKVLMAWGNSMCWEIIKPIGIRIEQSLGLLLLLLDAFK